MDKMFVLLPVCDLLTKEVVDVIYPVSRIKSIVAIKDFETDGPKSSLLFNDESGSVDLFCDVYSAYERLNKNS